MSTVRVLHKETNSIQEVTEVYYNNHKCCYILSPETKEEMEMTELEELQNKCRDLGIKFHPNSKEKSLRQKIEEKENDLS